MEMLHFVCGREGLQDHGKPTGLGKAIAVLYGRND